MGEVVITLDGVVFTLDEVVFTLDEVEVCLVVIVVGLTVVFEMVVTGPDVDAGLQFGLQWVLGQYPPLQFTLHHLSIF